MLVNLSSMFEGRVEVEWLKAFTVGRCTVAVGGHLPSVQLVSHGAAHLACAADCKPVSSSKVAQDWLGRQTCWEALVASSLGLRLSCQVFKASRAVQLNSSALDNCLLAEDLRLRQLQCRVERP